MNVLVAPDSFKGSITSREICDVVEKAILAKQPQSKVYKLAMADGGEDALHEMIPDKLPPEIKAIYDNAHSD